jgi:Spy/CpxP family protein refolding chaperone
MKKALIYSIIILLLTSGIQILKASPEPSDLVKHFLTWNFMAERNLFDGRLILGLKNEINLSAEQENKIENLMLSFEEHTITRGAEIKVREIRLASYIKSDKINRKEIEKILREISQMKIDFSISYLNYLLDIREIITPQQLKKLIANKARIKNIIRRNKVKRRANRR